MQNSHKIKITGYNLSAFSVFPVIDDLV